MRRPQGPPQQLRSPMYLYYDESGDLGFSFNAPYRKGGSSRFLTIGFLLVPQGGAVPIKRLMRKLYRRKNRLPSIEIKGSSLTGADKVWFAERLVRLTQTVKDIQLFSITINKRNVQQHIREDPNKLYNYATYLAVKDKIAKYEQVVLFPDPRAIKVKSGNSDLDYLKIALWFQVGSSVRLSKQLIPSSGSKALQCVDIVTNIIWNNFEDGRSEPYKILKSVVDIDTLFF